ncbi:MAG: FCD domain-containing protein, partial [Pseudomonadota bacterium]
EPHAAHLLASRDLSSESRAQLMGSVETMDRALGRGDLNRWAEADRQFHAQLIDLCGNTRLRDIVSGLWDQVHRSRMNTLTDREDLALSNEDHRALLKLIFAGDAVGAEALHREHRARAGLALTRILSLRGGSGL